MKTVALGEVADIVSGATPKTGVAEYWDGNVEWATPADLSKLDGPYIHSTPRKITNAGLRSCATRILPEGSVLLSSRAPIGHVAINTVPMATNQGFKSLVPGPDLDAKYLYHWLKSKTAYLQSLGNGATFKELSKKTAEQIRVPLPPIQEQRRIAAILDYADALRAKRRQVLVHLDSLSQSIFYDMFGDPSDAANPYPRGRLSDLVTAALDGPHVSPTYADTGIPFLSTRHVRPGRIVWSDLKFLAKAEAEIQWKKVRPEFGDVLYTKGGTTGIAAAVTTRDEFAVWVHVAVLKTNRAVAEPLWLETMLNSPYCYAQSQRLTHGIANRDLGLRRMVGIEVLLPSLKDQRRFSSRIEHVRTNTTASILALRATDELCASLQTRAFRGELHEDLLQ